LLADWGNYRELLLILDIIIITEVVELMEIFYSQYRYNPQRKITLYLSQALLCITLAQISSFIHIFYIDSGWLIKIYGIMLAGGLWIYLLSIQKEFKKINSVFFYFLSGIILFLIIYPYQDEIYDIFIAIVEIGYLFFFKFIVFIYRTNQGKIKKHMILAFIAYFIVLTGLGLNHPRLRLYIIPSISFENYVTILISAKICMIIGAYLLYISFKENVFLQIKWREQVLELYIVHPKSQQLLYTQRFNTNLNKSPEDKIIFTGGIVGLVENLQEFTKSKNNIESIDEGKIKILLEKGIYVIGVFIGYEDLSILHEILHEINQEFENTFAGVLKSEKDFSTFLPSFEHFSQILDQILKMYPGSQ
jgi:hypothetical protein